MCINKKYNYCKSECYPDDCTVCISNRLELEKQNEELENKLRASLDNIAQTVNEYEKDRYLIMDKIVKSNVMLTEAKKQNEELINEFIKLADHITSIKPLIYGIIENVKQKSIDEILKEIFNR